MSTSLNIDPCRLLWETLYNLINTFNHCLYATVHFTAEYLIETSKHPQSGNVFQLSISFTTCFTKDAADTNVTFLAKNVLSFMRQLSLYVQRQRNTGGLLYKILLAEALKFYFSSIFSSLPLLEEKRDVLPQPNSPVLLGKFFLRTFETPWNCLGLI